MSDTALIQQSVVAPAGDSDGTPTTFDVVAAVVALLLILMYVPGGWSPFTAPRLALCLAVVPFGLTVIVRLAARHHWASIAALALVAASVISAALSNAPAMSLLGAVNGHSSVVILVGALACWALGMCVSRNDSPLIGWTIVLGGATSGAVALVQFIAAPEGGAFAMYEDRPGGLAGHSVYFAGHMLACAAWFAFRLRRRLKAGDVAGFAAFGFLISLSGSRAAVLVVVALAGLVAFGTRNRWSLALIPVAIATSLVAMAVHRAAGSASSAGDRLGSSSGISDRVDVWLESWPAFLDNPWFGWGPGRFRIATQNRLSEEWLTRTPWADAHNIIVEVTVTQGIVGLAVFVWFLVAATRRAHGPMLWMSAAIAATWLFEPAPPQTLALSALLLGCSTANIGNGTKTLGDGSRPLVLGVAALGLALSALVLGAEMGAARVVDDARVTQFTGTTTWYRWDGRAASFASNESSFPGERDPQRLAHAAAWARRAVELDPDSSEYWGVYALRSLQANDFEEAQRAVDEALRLWGSNPLALDVDRILDSR